MKVVLSLAVLCLVLNNGLGAPPPMGRYMFLRCNPSQGNANCVQHRGPEMKLSPDLPARLPAAAADYMEAEPVKEEAEQMTEPEYGSGGFEGSSDGGYPFMADRAAPEPEVGSGGSLTVKDESEPNRILFGRRTAMPAAQELREDNLLL